MLPALLVHKSYTKLVTASSTTLIAFAILSIYVVVCAFWKRPRTDAGRLALKLCLVNVLSWVIVLPLDRSGDPPPVVIVGGLLWLLNLPLLIATIAALVVAFRSRQENRIHLTVTITYVLVNVIVLWLVPAIALFSLL